MTSSVQAMQTEQSPADVWHGLLRKDVELSPDFCAELNERMRAERLTFGDRIHCPFLRPFFLTTSDEERVRSVAETIARLGERVVNQALVDSALLVQVALNPEEERLARINPRYSTSSTASRLDAFLLPESLHFAEYNAESPAGLSYAEKLADIFDELPVMKRFGERYRVKKFSLIKPMLEAQLATYREWGGTASPPTIAIVDWRGVPTWSEFEILQANFEREGVQTIVCDPRDLDFDGTRLGAQGRPIDLLYRRVLINDIVAHRSECEAMIKAYAAGAVCVSNALTCKIAHKKAFFAVLTDERNASLFSIEELDLIRRHVPWTRILSDTRTEYYGTPLSLLEHVRQHREEFVLKPNDEYGGKGVTLGWEHDERRWDEAIENALRDPRGSWVVQKRIAVRREIFPMQTSTGAEMRDMLVDFAPYLFRGRMMGFLTRLSSTGLANVTSGGGQVPAFSVEPLQ